MDSNSPPREDFSSQRGTRRNSSGSTWLDAESEFFGSLRDDACDSLDKQLADGRLASDRMESRQQQVGVARTSAAS